MCKKMCFDALKKFKLKVKWQERLSSKDTMRRKKMAMRLLAKFKEIFNIAMINV